jgi:hypothetical protein
MVRYAGFEPTVFSLATRRIASNAYTAKVEPAKGFEPLLSRYDGDVLAINTTQAWSPQGESNSPLVAYHATVLSITTMEA